MIWWVYQQAKKTLELHDVYVATDDERIAYVCRNYDMLYVMTSDKHPSGTDRVAEVATKIEGDVFINIQGDEPLIEPEALSVLCSAMRNGTSFASLCNKVTDRDEINSPNTVKVVINTDGYAMYMSRSVIPSGLKGHMGEVFRHVGIYAYTREILQQFVAMPQSELELAEGIEPLRLIEKGAKLKMIETVYSSIGVDTQQDLKKVCAIIAPAPASDIIG
jgi:3-deoxy-manno-octulosonate cytidylyltransferase (CMP-KDO synthetase)